MNKEMTPNEKRREANIKRARPKRLAKAKEYEQKYQDWLNGEIEEVDNPGDRFPSNARAKANGNPAIGQAIRNNMMFYLQEPVRDDNELCERLNWYFKVCSDTDQLPTFEKMCLACGYGKDWIYDILNGRTYGFSPITAVILQKARNILASIDGELALQSKLSPVVYIFRAKNFYDMSDKQEVVTTTSDPLSGISIEGLEEKYKQLPKK